MPLRRQLYQSLTSNAEGPVGASIPALIPPNVPPLVTGNRLRGEVDVGLTSPAAYKKLFAVADAALQQWQQQKPKILRWRASREHIDDVLKHGTLKEWPTDRLTPLSCAMTLVVAAVVIGLTNVHEHYRSSELAILSGVLALSAVLLLATILHERRLRHIELASRLEAIIRKFKMMERHGVSLNHYSNLKDYFPSSSCDRVPTWRDGTLVGVPAVLLVAGDRIVLKAGDRAPAHIRRVFDDQQSLQEEEDEEIAPGEVIDCDCGSNVSGKGGPVHKSHISSGVDFEVVDGILEENLEVIHSVSKSRRRTALNNERILGTIVIQRFAMVVWIVATFANVLRLVVLPDDMGFWEELLILLPLNCTLPFLPLAFPLLWVAANLFATAQLFALLPSRQQSSSEPSPECADTVSLDSWDSDSSDDIESAMHTSRLLVLQYFFQGLQGDAGILTRTTSMVHVLGNFSVLSCIDKRGILAHPMPSPQTVFTFEKRRKGDDEQSGSPSSREEVNQTDNIQQNDQHAGEEDDRSSGSDHVPITLDILNHPNHKPNTLWFASKTWDEHMGSLKPLGLAMMLNCGCRNNFLGRELGDHRTAAECSAGKVPDNILMGSARSQTGPRGCLCRLAMEIGFIESAISLFVERQVVTMIAPALKSSNSLSATSISQSSMSTKSSLSQHDANSQSQTVPYISSVIVEEVDQGSMQLFSCGDGEMILRHCSEFWDGKCVVSLNEQERQAVLDFYRKTSSSMCCYAYSYRPIYTAAGVLKSNSRAVLINLPSTIAHDPSYYQLDKSHSSVSSKSHSSEVVSPVSQEPRFTRLGSIGSATSPIGFDGGKFRSRSDSDPAAAASIRRDPSDPNSSVKLLKDNTVQSSVDCFNSNRFIRRKSHVGGYQDMVNNQIFLGMVAVQDQPMNDVTSLIEDLEDSGIRFIYFSAENGADSKTFATKLGLETGWNCHISLSKTVDSDYEEAEQNARLPRGIDEIRPHIENVDDVPLLVPLFSGCTPTTTAEMIEIMQEHRRVVCCLGSSMNSFNVHAFAQADMSVAFDPIRSPTCLGLESQSRPSVSFRGAASAPLANTVRRAETTAEIIAAHFNTLPCSFCIPRDADFRFEVLLRESRRLSLNFRQCFSFVFYSQGVLSLINLVPQFVLLPPIMNGLQVMWLLMVPLPIIAASLLTAQAEQGIMDLRTSDLSRKDGLHQRVKQYSIYFIVRALPTVVALVTLFGVVLNDACHFRGHFDCHPVLGSRDRGNGTGTVSWNGRGGDELSDLVLAQNVCCWLLVLNWCVTSSSMIHRSLPVHKTINRVWLVAVVGAMLLQSCFFAATAAGYLSSGSYTLHDLPLAAYLISGGGLLCLGIANEKVRRHFKAIDIRDQKRMVLAFGTKLGMHSPQ